MTSCRTDQYHTIMIIDKHVQLLKRMLQILFGNGVLTLHEEGSFFLLNSRSVSKLQTPFTTWTEWNFSRKTLSWLGSGISLGVGSQMTPQIYSSETHRFTKLRMVLRCYSFFTLNHSDWYLTSRGRSVFKGPYKSTCKVLNFWLSMLGWSEEFVCYTLKMLIFHQNRQICLLFKKVWQEILSFWLKIVMILTKLGYNFVT